MKKILVLLVFVLNINIIFGQDENYIKNVHSFKENYNSGHYEIIFNSFSEEMQKALPREQTFAFLSNLKSQVGKIISMEFISFENISYASYKTVFEKETFSFNLSIDDAKKINGLFLKPFVKEITNQKVVINSLTGLTENKTSIIFDKVKNLPDHVQISIAFIENGIASYYGILKQNDSIKSLDNKEKIFEIGSITKVLTSTLLADAVLQKKIKLEDKVNKYYNFSFKGGIEFDFISLANHTSGLERLPSNLNTMATNADNPYQLYNEQKLTDYLKNDLKLSSTELKKYDYSNLGTGLLGHTLALVQKTSYEKLLSEKIFKKYKMENSFTNKQNAQQLLVKGLDEEGNSVGNWDFDVLSPAGGVLSTVTDLSKFAIAQFNPANKELLLTRTPTHTINDTMKIGLGWHIIKSKSGTEMYWHNGGTASYSSSMAIETTTKKGIIILSNVGSFDCDSLCFELMKSLQ